MKEPANVANEASQVQTSQPCLMVRASSGAVKYCFLIVEKMVVNVLFFIFNRIGSYVRSIAAQQCNDLIPR